MKIKKAINFFKKSPNKSFTIFLFHGVLKKKINRNSVINYNNKHISIKSFKFFLKEILKIGNPISMDEVCELVKKKKITKKSFAITFDDGFENNISVAAPILLKLNIPFIIYITTKFINENEISWADKIDYATEKTKIKKINIKELNKNYILKTKASKILFLNEIRDYVKNNKYINPDKFSYEICKRLKIKNFPKKSEVHKMSSWKKLQELLKNKLFSIGGHSHTHKILNFLDDKNLNYEINQSIKLIKKKLGINLRHYSYPEGLRNSFSKKTIRFLKKKSIKCAPTAIPGTNNLKTNLFLLKRVSVN